MAAGFMDGDTPPQALGLGVLLEPSLEALIQGAEPSGLDSFAGHGLRLSCAGLGVRPRSRHDLMRSGEASLPHHTPTLEHDELGRARGKASTGPALSGT
jgi:hypothetical protein